MNFKEFNVKYKDEGNGSIEGYASTFVREPDCYGDVVKAGAFRRTLKEWEKSGRPIPFLWAHEMNNLASFIGSAKANEDDYGLHFVAEFDGTPEAQRVRALYKDGRLSKFSFAYDVLEAGEVTLEDGRKANELRELRLYEISAVTVPANDTAEVIEVKNSMPANAVKWQGDWFRFEPDYSTICVDHIKAGRRNSKADEDAIRQAIALLQGVLDAEDPEDGEDGAKANVVTEEPKQSNPEKAKLLEYIKSMEDSKDEH